MTPRPPPPLIQPCTTCWIEVVLLDEHDRGVAREPYWIRLPDGVVREGRLDDQGFVRLDEIPCGTCTVRFPRLDDRELQTHTQHKAGATDWLELRLLDDAGRPVAGARYSVTTPDGQRRTGSLDERGQARLEGLAAGDCVVQFPDIDTTDFVEK